MFRGEYKNKNFDGSPLFYKRGDSILFHGKIYEAKDLTVSSPIENSDIWLYKGLSEIYYSDNPPLNPKVGQVWLKEGKYYSYFYDGNNYSWVEF